MDGDGRWTGSGDIGDTVRACCGSEVIKLVGSFDGGGAGRRGGWRKQECEGFKRSGVTESKGSQSSTKAVKGEEHGMFLGCNCAAMGVHRRNVMMWQIPLSKGGVELSEGVQEYYRETGGDGRLEVGSER